MKPKKIATPASLMHLSSLGFPVDDQSWSGPVKSLTLRVKGGSIDSSSSPLAFESPTGLSFAPAEIYQE